MLDYISFSQIRTFLLCPRKYRFRYLDRLEAESRSVHLALGTAVHGAIGWWCEKRIAQDSPEADQVNRIFRGDWLAELAADKIDFQGRTPEELSALGTILVSLFTERFAEIVPTTVEQRMEVTLVDTVRGGTLPIPLLGYLDLEADDLVWELKTTARKASPSNWALQLAAYSYAVRETTGQRPRMRLVQLIKTKEPKLEVTDLTLTDQEEAWFVEIASEAFHAIRKGVFFPNPGWMCPRCEYRGACRG